VDAASKAKSTSFVHRGLAYGLPGMPTASHAKRNHHSWTAPTCQWPPILKSINRDDRTLNLSGPFTGNVVSPRGAICLAALSREGRTETPSYLESAPTRRETLAWQLVVPDRRTYEKSVGDGTIDADSIGPPGGSGR
jgi:hypothetical protein